MGSIAARNATVEIPSIVTQQRESANVTQGGLDPGVKLVSSLLNRNYSSY